MLDAPWPTQHQPTRSYGFAPCNMRAGWVNKSVEEFIVDSFGEDKWNQILSESKVTEVAWVSSCAYADSITYE